MKDASTDTLSVAEGKDGDIPESSVSGCQASNGIGDVMFPPVVSGRV